VNLSFVRAASNGLVESAGYEGDFVSGRRPFNWGYGTCGVSGRSFVLEDAVLDPMPVVWQFKKSAARQAVWSNGITALHRGVSCDYLPSLTITILHSATPLQARRIHILDPKGIV
jgi:hypothetical protein